MRVAGLTGGEAQDAPSNEGHRVLTLTIAPMRLEKASMVLIPVHLDSQPCFWKCDVDPKPSPWHARGVFLHGVWPSLSHRGPENLLRH